MAKMSQEEIEAFKKNNPLSPALNGKFQLKDALAGVYVQGGKEYDLRKISLAQAHELVEVKFPYLEPVAGAKAAKAE